MARHGTSLRAPEGAALGKHRFREATPTARNPGGGGCVQAATNRPRANRVVVVVVVVVIDIGAMGVI
ncbi:hypothetical protein MB02_08740 [Croceicoccus estronivorus]|nr:hypothetical protein MB02_08740 [Croceicoccus estronivorus]